MGPKNALLQAKSLYVGLGWTVLGRKDADEADIDWEGHKKFAFEGCYRQEWMRRMARYALAQSRAQQFRPALDKGLGAV